MQHGVYTILSRWWTTRKKELKKQLEMWGADSVLKLTLNLRRRRQDVAVREPPRRGRRFHAFATAGPAPHPAVHALRRSSVFFVEVSSVSQTFGRIFVVI